jgi:hypothetical protein
MKTTPKTPRSSALEAFANPAYLVENIEGESEAADAPYWRRYEALVAAFLEEEKDPDSTSDATHLKETQGGFVLEKVARQAGFVMGFEYCRQLLSGPTTRKGGAR